MYNFNVVYPVIHIPEIFIFKKLGNVTPRLYYRPKVRNTFMSGLEFRLTYS